MVKNFNDFKYNRNLKIAEDRANQLIASQGEMVACEYCGKPLRKEYAEKVYNLEYDRMEYSHERCFNENNVIHDGPPIPIEEVKQDG